MIYFSISYILVFTTVTCFGYLKLEDEEYASYEAAKKKPYTVFKMNQFTADITMSVFQGTQKLIFNDLDFLFSQDHQGRMVCMQYSPYTVDEKIPTQYRLSITVKEHGIGKDYVELDQVAVKSCEEGEKGEMANKIVLEVKPDVLVTTQEKKTHYTLTFKSLKGKCYKREITVTETVLTLQIFRTEPMRIECRDVKDLSIEGSVIHKSWLPNGEWLHGDAYFTTRYMMISLLKSGQDSKSDQDSKSSQDSKGGQEIPIVLHCRDVTIDNQQFNFVYIYWDAISIDRFIATDCSKLESSINNNGVDMVEGRQGTVEANLAFITTDGNKLERKYEFTMAKLLDSPKLPYVIKVTERLDSEKKTDLQIDRGVLSKAWSYVPKLGLFGK